MYRYDMRNKTPQQRAIVNRNDEENQILLEQSKNKIMADRKRHVYNKILFMRLGINPYNQFSGEDTITAYVDFCRQNSSTWFCTDSLSTGMSRRHINEFKQAIRDGYTVEIYFAIGNKGGGKNEIEYKADVMDIKSNNIQIPTPDPTLTPIEWANDCRYIWIKIHNIQASQLKTKDFTVISSGEILTESIRHSQFHFGYIKRV